MDLESGGWVRFGKGDVPNHVGSWSLVDVGEARATKAPLLAYRSGVLECDFEVGIDADPSYTDDNFLSVDLWDGDTSVASTGASPKSGLSVASAIPTFLSRVDDAFAETEGAISKYLDEDGESDHKLTDLAVTAKSRDYSLSEFATKLRRSVEAATEDVFGG